MLYLVGEEIFQRYPARRQDFVGYLPTKAPPTAIVSAFRGNLGSPMERTGACICLYMANNYVGYIAHQNGTQ